MVGRKVKKINTCLDLVSPCATAASPLILLAGHGHRDSIC